MFSFVYDNDEEIGNFVAARADMPRGLWPNSKTIGVVDEQGRFLGGVAYHHWSPEAGTIVMSGAALSPRWLTRAVLQRIFDYPFIECRCQMLIMQPKASNFRLLRQLAAVGFALTRIVRLYGRNEDGVIATLTEEDWRSSPFNRAPIKLEEAA